MPRHYRLDGIYSNAFFLYKRCFDNFERNRNLPCHAPVLLRDNGVRGPAFRRHSFLIVYGHVIANQMFPVIIEENRIRSAVRVVETPFETTFQVIHEYFPHGHAIDKHFVIGFVQYDSVDGCIFFGSLSFSVYFSDAFSRLSVKEKNIAVGCSVFG